MKRIIYFIAVILICVSTVYLAICKDIEIYGKRPNSGIAPSSEFITNQPSERTLPIINPPEQKRPASQNKTSTSQEGESSGGVLLVNADNPLPKNFCPENLVNLYDQKNRHFQLATADIKICETVFEAMEAMFTAAQKGGVKGFIITSGYRSYEKQKEVFATSAYGIAAKPSESEHETGLAFDVTSMGNENFELTPQFEWLSQHCSEYGFIIRYPKGMEDITGFPYEPWHYRYVGKEHATIIMEKGMTLEQYLDGMCVKKR